MCMPPDRACTGPGCVPARPLPELPMPSEPPNPAPVQP
jgi:hypothetical protein